MSTVSSSPIDSSAAQAMLLAAGRGNRMRPLTDHTPKPLLVVNGKPLLEWSMRALAAQASCRVLVNTGWLGQQIPDYFGAEYVHSLHDSPLPNTQLIYSREELDFGHALETAGGIARALPFLQDVFWLLAGDIYAPDFVFSAAHYERFAASNALAHLWLVPNPEHHPQGDFVLDVPVLTSSDDNCSRKHGKVQHWAQLQNLDPATVNKPCYTYSTIALMRRELFSHPWCDIPAGNPQGITAALAPVLRAAVAAGRVTGSLYHGCWVDVGTPERLAEINQHT